MDGNTEAIRAALSMVRVRWEAFRQEDKTSSLKLLGEMLEHRNMGDLAGALITVGANLAEALLPPRSRAGDAGSRRVRQVEADRDACRRVGGASCIVALSVAMRLRLRPVNPPKACPRWTALD
jgi:hypothetical protein